MGLFNLFDSPKGPPKPRPLRPVLRRAIEWGPSPDFTPVKFRKIDMGVLHGTEGPMKGSLIWLQRAGRKNPSSANYMVGKDGRVVQLVEDRNIAWHAIGKWRRRGGVNRRSIGIELETKNRLDSQYPRPQLEAVLWLCVNMCVRHGFGAQDWTDHGTVDVRMKDGKKRKVDPYGFPWAKFRPALEDALKKYGIKRRRA